MLCCHSVVFLGDTLSSCVAQHDCCFAKIMSPLIRCFVCVTLSGHCHVVKWADGQAQMILLPTLGLRAGRYFEFE